MAVRADLGRGRVRVAGVLGPLVDSDLLVTGTGSGDLLVTAGHVGGACQTGRRVCRLARRRASKGQVQATVNLVVLHQ